jgi:hypothetical protein
MPAKFSGECSTSSGRPSSRSTTASIAGVVASGFVPATALDGGLVDLRLGGGERGGPDCFCITFRGVLPAYTRGLCVTLSFLGVLCVNCTSAAYYE